jgi:xylene monooxygenase subunit XylM
MDYLRYYLATAVVMCGVLGFYWGGYWVFLGVGTFIPLLILDMLLPYDYKPREIRYPILADLPLYLHVLLMFAVYAAFIHWAATAGSIVPGQWLGAILTLGWLGAVPNLPVNHELMHRRGRLARACATILGTFYADPTRDVAHVHTHHIHLATPNDSDTARRGETVYSFVFRATAGAFGDFLKLEKESCKRRNVTLLHPGGRLFKALLQLAVLLGICAWFASPAAALAALAGIVTAKLLVEMFNYYQHYGLVRVLGSNYGQQHLWNHLKPISRQLSFEITNHNDHHMDSYLPFYRLQPKVDGPQMPSILLCFLAGLVPPIWFSYIAQPRLKDWDLKHATAEEKELAREANRSANWPDWLYPELSH